MEQQQLVAQTQEYMICERMIFVRIHYTLSLMIRAPIIAICFCVIAVSSFAQYSFGSLRVLDFTIYNDGTTHIFYQTSVNPQLPDFTVKLFGNSTDNFVAQDENSTLLSSKISANSATIQTLGASTVKIDYDTADLVTKNGKTWTFHINSPFDYSVLLPKNTVIVGMNTSPIDMQVVDDQSLISLPTGSADISYVFGVLGTNKTATVAIEKARDLINQINSQNIKTPMASAKLAEAVSAFKGGKFSDAEALANDAKNLATQEQGSSNSTSHNPFASIESTVVGTAATIGTVAGAVVTVTLLIKRAKSAIKKTVELLPKNEKYVAPDKETIFRLKPELRQEDKDIITFISENGGQVYESELRKKFLLPRTTTWRAVKRLEREGIVEIEKIDQQNLIKLRKIQEENKE